MELLMRLLKNWKNNPIFKKKSLLRLDFYESFINFKIKR
jgi:hypothetical protein